MVGLLESATIPPRLTQNVMGNNGSLSLALCRSSTPPTAHHTEDLGVLVRPLVRLIPGCAALRKSGNQLGEASLPAQ